MKLFDLVEALGLQVRSGQASLQKEVTGGYASDLLSDVLAHARPGDLWITLQRHVNIVAVASKKQLAGIALVNGREPEGKTIQRARAEEVPVLVSRLPTFELAGRLWELVVPGPVDCCSLRAMFPTVRCTKMEDLSLHMLDIVENALAASADRVRIRIREDTLSDLLLLEIEDNGRGMEAELRDKALDPFFTTKPSQRVGLGLPLLAQSAREGGGSLTLISEAGRGTTVRAVFQRSHPDRKPLGDIAETLLSILASRPELDLRFDYTRDAEVLATLHCSRFHDEESDHGCFDD